MKGTAVRFAWLALAAASQLMWTANCRAIEATDIDPENGESYIKSYRLIEQSDHYLLRGELRATDDFGVVRDREFRTEIHGDRARGTRKVVLHRYEPECINLSAQARMSVDQFCDRLTLTYADQQIELDFHSVDANQHYRISMLEDPRAPGQWQSRYPSGVQAPELTLSLQPSTQGSTYQWKMSGVRNIYSQHGELTSEWTREVGLSAVEGSLLALGEVLRSFNSYEFQFSDLPRDHPEYQPTPYLGFGGEQPVEGGCIFIICFGDFGGGGDGGGNTPGERCDPRSENYTPADCPHDLTYDTWPTSQRVKIWKINNDRVGFSLWLLNAGTGPFNSGAAGIGNGSDGADADFVFVSLVRLGESQPLVPAPVGNSNVSPSYPYGSDCHKSFFPGNSGVLDPLSGFVTISLEPGMSFPLPGTMPCSKAKGRPEGRYRLWLRVDPSHVYDTEGYEFNNTGDSGPVDWVNLKN